VTYYCNLQNRHKSQLSPNFTKILFKKKKFRHTAVICTQGIHTHTHTKILSHKITIAKLLLKKPN